MKGDKINEETHDFGEVVDNFAREVLDSIRYGEVEYKNSEKAEKRDEMREDLLRKLDDSARSEVQEYFEEVDQMFGKYDGESDSGPSAFLLFVDDEAESAVQDSDYAVPLHSPDWNKYDWSDDGVPDVDHEELDQVVHDVMTDNDGAMVIGEDGIYQDTVEIQGSELSVDDYPEVGGTKHKAAVDAMYDDLTDEDGEEVYREALILSGKTGYARHFRPAEEGSDKKFEIKEFPYDGDAETRVPEGWWTPPRELEELKPDSREARV